MPAMYIGYLSSFFIKSSFTYKKDKISRTIFSYIVLKQLSCGITSLGWVGWWILCLVGKIGLVNTPQMFRI